MGVKRVREWSSDYNASPDIKLAQQKLMDRFISTLQDFQGVQRLGAEKVRMYGRPERYRDEEEAVPALAQAEGESREREEEIRGIEEGIEEVNDIFKEFGVDVQEQNEELDAIRGDAEWELEREARYRARKRAGCFLLFVALVVVIVVGAVSYTILDEKQR